MVRPPKIGRRREFAVPPKRPDFVGPHFDRVLGQVNPFPGGHRLHHEWEDRRRRAAAKPAKLWRRLIAKRPQTWEDVIAFWVAWRTGVFDLRASAWHFPMAPSDYAAIIDDHAQAILAHVEDQALPIGDELVPARQAAIPGYQTPDPSDV